MSARDILSKYSIVDLEGGDKFTFVAMPEGGFSISKSPNWEDTGIIGRSSPIKGYRDSSPRRISMTIPLFSSIEQGDGRTPKDVDDACRFFLSLAYPDYDGGIKPPHKCAIIAGDQKVLSIDFVVVTSVDISLMAPWDTPTGMAHRATVNITFEEADDTPKGWKEVRGGGNSISSMGFE